MIGRIHADLFFQTRYLLNEVNVKIKLTKYTDAFGTMSPTANASKVHILGAIMYMRKVKLSTETTSSDLPLPPWTSGTIATTSSDLQQPPGTSRTTSTTFRCDHFQQTLTAAVDVWNDRDNFWQPSAAAGDVLDQRDHFQ